MELAFQAIPARNNVLAGMAGTHTPTYTVKTPKSVTTFTRRDAEEEEDRWVAEVQWSLSKSKCIVRTQEQGPGVQLSDFLRRDKWYSYSRSFTINNKTYTWVDNSVSPLRLIHARAGNAEGPDGTDTSETSEPLAVLHSKIFRTATLTISELGLREIGPDMIVVTGIVMLFRRRDR